MLSYSRKWNRYAPGWAAVATFITTSISYYLSWTFYFPPLP